MTAKPNETVKLSGKANDPDGDKLTFKWWQYEEVGTYKGKLKMETTNRRDGKFSVSTFTMPKDIKKGETIHIILEVTDNKTLPLTRYQRVIVTSE